MKNNICKENVFCVLKRENSSMNKKILNIIIFMILCIEKKILCSLENQNPSIATLQVLGTSTLIGQVTMNSGCSILNNGLDVTGDIYLKSIAPTVGTNFVVVDTTGKLSSNSGGGSSAVFNNLTVNEKSVLQGSTTITGSVTVNTTGDPIQQNITIGNKTKSNQITLGGSLLYFDSVNLAPQEGFSYLTINKDGLVSSTNSLPLVFDTLTVNGLTTCNGQCTFLGNTTINGTNFLIENLYQDDKNKYLVVDANNKISVASGGEDTTQFDTITVTKGPSNFNGVVNISGNLKYSGDGTLQLGNSKNGGPITIATSNTISLSANSLVFDIRKMRKPSASEILLLTIDSTGFIDATDNPFSPNPQFNTLTVKGQSNLKNTVIQGNLSIEGSTVNIGNISSTTTIDGTNLKIVNLASGTGKFLALDSNDKVILSDAGTSSGQFENITVSGTSTLSGNTIINNKAVFNNGNLITIKNLTRTQTQKYLSLDQNNNLVLIEGGKDPLTIDTLTVLNSANLAGVTTISGDVKINTNSSDSKNCSIGNATEGGNIICATKNTINFQGKNIIFDVASLKRFNSNIITVDSQGNLNGMQNPFDGDLTFASVNVLGDAVCEGNVSINGLCSINNNCFIGNKDSNTILNGKNLKISNLYDAQKPSNIYLGINSDGQIIALPGSSSQGVFSKLTVSDQSTFNTNTIINDSIVLDGANFIINGFDTTGNKKYLGLKDDGKTVTTFAPAQSANETFKTITVTGTTLLQGAVTIQQKTPKDIFTVNSPVNFTGSATITGPVSLNGIIEINRTGFGTTYIGNSLFGGNISFQTKKDINFQGNTLSFDFTSIPKAKDEATIQLITIKPTGVISSADFYDVFKNIIVYRDVMATGNVFLDASQSNNTIKLIGNNNKGSIIIDGTGNLVDYKEVSNIVLNGSVSINEFGDNITTINGLQLNMGGSLITFSADKYNFLDGNNFYVGTSTKPFSSVTINGNDFSILNNSCGFKTENQNLYLKLSQSSLQQGTYIVGLVPSGGANSYRIVAIPNQSSRRFKENILPLDDKEQEILQLQPVTFNYIEDSSQAIHYGYLAEDFESNNIFKELILYDDNKKPLSIDYQSVFVAATQVLAKKCKEVNELEKSLHELEDIMKRLGIL
jgi:hypothetical protein